MNDKEARKELNLYKTLDEKRKMLKQKISALNEDLFTIGGGNGEFVSGGELNKTEKMLVTKIDKICKYRNELSDIIIQCNDYCDFIIRKIDRVKNSTTRMVLIALYVQGFTLTKLAKKEHYSYDYLKNVSSRAIDEYISYN